MNTKSPFPIRTVLAALYLLPATPIFANQGPHSSLALPGRDAKLSYPPYTEQGDCLPDFSWCGYRGGGCALPRLLVKVTHEPVPEGDDTARVHNAIKEVSAMPPDRNGFRGAVLLKRGSCRVKKC